MPHYLGYLSMCIRFNQYGPTGSPVRGRPPHPRRGSPTKRPLPGPHKASEAGAKAGEEVKATTDAQEGEQKVGRSGHIHRGFSWRWYLDGLWLSCDTFGSWRTDGCGACRQKEKRSDSFPYLGKCLSHQAIPPPEMKYG